MGRISSHATPSWQLNICTGLRGINEGHHAIKQRRWFVLGWVWPNSNVEWDFFRQQIGREGTCLLFSGFLNLRGEHSWKSELMISEQDIVWRTTLTQKFPNFSVPPHSPPMHCDTRVLMVPEYLWKAWFVSGWWPRMACGSNQKWIPFKPKVLANQKSLLVAFSGYSEACRGQDLLSQFNLLKSFWPHHEHCIKPM